MKKFLLLTLVLTWSAYAQQLPLFEESESRTKSTKSSTNFNETVRRANAYFATRDIDKKGSGYKPFKRWEKSLETLYNARWNHYSSGTPLASLGTEKGHWPLKRKQRAIGLKWVPSISQVKVAKDDSIRLW